MDSPKECTHNCKNSIKSSKMEEKEKCGHGMSDGSCCCNCKNQIELFKHPMNKDFGKGSIMDKCGYVCLNHEVTEGKSGIYFDNQHGMCECYEKK